MAEADRIGLEIQLLGGLDVRTGAGAPLSFATRKSLAILAILALSPGAAVAREKLAGLLWSDRSEPQARASLRQSLALLRKALEPAQVPGILRVGENLYLDRTGVTVDVWRFESALARNDTAALEEAVGLYRGELLDGFNLPDRGFEDWLSDARAQLRESVLGALDRLLRDHLAAGRTERAAHAALRLLGMDPLREDIHRHLMQLYWRQGRRTAALEQYRRCRDVLQREFGEKPDAETEALHDEIKRHRTPPQIDAGHHDAPTSPPLASPPLASPPLASPPLASPPLASPPAESSAATSRSTSGAAPERRGLREACLLLVELVGFQDHSLTGDPEACDDLLQRFYDQFERTTVPLGGRPESLFQGIAVASFGIPVAHGNDAERALAAAHALLSPDTREDVGPPFERRCAVAAGALLWDGESEGRHRLPTLSGRPLAEGHRLLAQAAPGEVLVNTAAREAAGRRFRFQSAVAGPLAAWRSLGRAEAADPLRRAPLVGRDGELAQVEALLTACRRRHQGQRLYLRGPAGIGKTRLVEHLVAMAESQGFTCHTAQVLDFGVVKEKEAITVLACRLLGLAQEAPSAASRQEAAEACLAAGIVAEKHRAPLYDLLALPLRHQLAPAYDAIGGPAREAAKQAVLASLLRASCRRAPVAIIVEDIHWADAAILDHLAALSCQLRHLPVLLVMTGRSETDPLDDAWRRRTEDSPLAILDVTPLDDDAAGALARGLGDLPEPLLADCIARAEGNPLFLEQLLVHALDTRAVGVPHSLQSLISARLDALPPAERKAIEAAAVLGQRFSLDCLRHVLERPDYDCDGLVAQRLVRPDGEALLFAHALIQEGTYAAMLKRDRQALHRRAAGWFADRDSTLAAQHLDRAEASEAAHAYLRAAQEQARLHRFDRALELLQRGLALGRKRQDLYALHAHKGEIEADTGSAAQAVEAYRQALTHAGSNAERCRAWIGLASGVRASDSYYEESMAALAQAEAIAVEEGLMLELAQIYATRGNVFFPRGAIEAGLAEQLKACDYARKAGSPKLECRALSGIGDAYYAQGRMATAHGYFERCIALSREHGLKTIEVANLSMLGETNYYQNRLDVARDYFLTGLSEAARLGHQRAEMIAAMAHSDILAPAEVRALNERGLVLARQLGARRFEPLALLHIAETLALEGQSKGAIEAATEARRLSLETGPRFVGPWALGTLALVSRNRRQRLRALDEGEALLAEGCVSHNVFWFHHHAIETALELADWPRADRYADALQAFAAAEPLPWADFVVARGRALAARGRGERSDALAQSLAALKEQAGQIGRQFPLPKLEEALVRP